MGTVTVIVFPSLETAISGTPYNSPYISIVVIKGLQILAVIFHGILIENA